MTLNSASLCPPPGCWDYKYPVPGLCGTGRGTQGLTHARQALCWLVTSLFPVLLLLLYWYLCVCLCVHLCGGGWWRPGLFDLKSFFFVLFYVYECFFLFHVHVWYPRKRTLDPLELGLQMVVIHHVVTGNWALFLCQSSLFLATEPSLNCNFLR